MPNSNPIDARPAWIEPSPIRPTSNWRELDANPLVAAILYRRGIHTVADASVFMHPAQQATPDPFRIPNLLAATERIVLAIHRGECVGIFGDYDADGITSTAILTESLGHALNPSKVIARLPHRSEGYGLNETAIDEFAEAGVQLVIAVDCGSSDHAGAALVAARGMDLVIVDHHRMRDAGPEAAITVSPQLDDDPAYHDLTAAGVAWLLVCALASRGVRIAANDGDAASMLDLAALGTVADVAPLSGINRALVARGVEAIRVSARPGLVALLETANVAAAAVTAETISFALAPRINAAGRMGSPQLAFNLLTTRSAAEARRLAKELEGVNLQRKSRSAQVLAEAWAAVTQLPDWPNRPIYAIQDAGWESGLVGAVASRLAEEARRPVLLFREDDGGVLSGSARSIDGFNLVDALEAVEPLLIRFGGHSQAAGLALAGENLASLEAHLVSAMLASSIEIPAPKQLRIDATLPPEYVSLETVREIARMEPFGRGNEQPVLRIAGAQLLRYSALGADRSHLKIFAKIGNRQIEAICWGAAVRSRELVTSRTIDLVGKLEINAWNGQERLQMILADFRAS